MTENEKELTTTMRVLDYYRKSKYNKWPKDTICLPEAMEFVRIFNKKQQESKNDIIKQKRYRRINK